MEVYWLVSASWESPVVDEIFLTVEFFFDCSSLSTAGLNMKAI